MRSVYYFLQLCYVPTSIKSFLINCIECYSFVLACLHLEWNLWIPMLSWMTVFSFFVYIILLNIFCITAFVVMTCLNFWSLECSYGSIYFNGWFCWVCQTHLFTYKGWYRPFICTYFTLVFPVTDWMLYDASVFFIWGGIFTLQVLILSICLATYF